MTNMAEVISGQLVVSVLKRSMESGLWHALAPVPESGPMVCGRRGGPPLSPLSFGLNVSATLMFLQVYLEEMLKLETREY